MTELLFTDNATTTLAAPVGASDIAFSVASGTNFPSPSASEGFYVRVQEGSKSEYMLVTGRNGNDFSGVTRDATSPQTFSMGASVKVVLCAEVLRSFIQKGTEREVTVSPDGSLEAEYQGEEVLLTTDNTWWKHTIGTEWKKMGQPALDAEVAGGEITILPTSIVENKSWSSDVPPQFLANVGWYIYDGWTQGAAAVYTKINSGCIFYDDSTMIAGIEQNVGGASFAEGFVIIGFEDPGCAITSFTVRFRASQIDTTDEQRLLYVYLYDGATLFAGLEVGEHASYSIQRGYDDQAFNEYSFTSLTPLTAVQAAQLRVAFHVAYNGYGGWRYAISEVEITVTPA